MNKNTLKFLSILILAGSLAACSDTNTSSRAYYPNHPTQYAVIDTTEFVAKVAASDKFEIASSRLALRRSHNKNVQHIARTMITDHTNSSAKLKTILVADRILIPQGNLNPMQQQTLNDLKNSKNFDADYLDAQAKAHRHAIGLFEHYVRSGDNTDIRNFAAQTLPILHQHYEMVEQAQQ